MTFPPAWLRSVAGLRGADCDRAADVEVRFDRRERHRFFFGDACAFRPVTGTAEAWAGLGDALVFFIGTGASGRLGLRLASCWATARSRLADAVSWRGWMFESRRNFGHAHARRGGHGEQDGHAHFLVAFLVEAGAGGDRDVDGQPFLEGADHFLHVGKAEIARAADRDDGVIDLFPDRFVGQQRGWRAVRATRSSVRSWMSPSTCAAQQFSSTSEPA